MALRIKRASEGKVFAYKDSNGKEIVCGSTLYLGKNDDGSRYYEIDKPQDKNDDIVVNDEQ